MFLSDPRRRFLARCVFVLACVLPTLATVVFAAVWSLTNHRAAAERKLSALLGCTVQIRQANPLEPGAMRYLGVKLIDPDAGTTLGEAAYLECRTSGSTSHLSLAHVELTTLGAQALGERIRRLLFGELPGTCRLRLSADEVNLTSADGSSARVVDLHGGVEPSSAQSHAYLSFRVPDVEGHQARVRLIRSHGSHRRLAVELNTGTAPVSCTLFAPWCEELATLSGASFRGQFVSSTTDDASEAELSGDLTGFDLSHLVGPRLPANSISGTANLSVWAKLRNGRVQDTLGTLTATNGSISAAMIQRSVQEFGLAWNPARPAIATPSISFRTLSLGFDLNGDHVTLRGEPRGAEQGAIVVDAQGPLVRETNLPASPAALLRVLAPTGLPAVPLAPENESIARRLPLGTVPQPR